MKAKTISGIYDLLKQKKDIAFGVYHDLKVELTAKYNMDWLVEENLSSEDFARLSNAEGEYYVARDLFEDFEQHQW